MAMTPVSPNFPSRLRSPPLLPSHVRHHLPSLPHRLCPWFRACPRPITLASRGVELRNLLLHDLGRSSLLQSGRKLRGLGQRRD